MPRQAAWHKIPQTSRIVTTITAQELKEIRKISIDLEIPESEVFRYAILNLIEQYRKTPVDELIRNSQLLLAKPEMHECKNNVKSNNT